MKRIYINSIIKMVSTDTYLLSDNYVSYDKGKRKFINPIIIIQTENVNDDNVMVEFFHKEDYQHELLNKIEDI